MLWVEERDLVKLQNLGQVMGAGGCDLATLLLYCSPVIPSVLIFGGNTGYPSFISICFLLNTAHHIPMVKTEPINLQEAV